MDKIWMCNRKNTIKMALLILCIILSLIGCKKAEEPSQEVEKEAPVPEEIVEESDGALPALSVEGTQLVDENGNAVQLGGISTHGIAWFPEYINQECFNELASDWNANVVRLAMYTAENGGYCTGGDQERLKQLVKDGVQYATEAGMYVVVDWHILSDQNPNQYKEEAKAFFDEMVSEFGDRDNILYEICNEPNGATTWQDIKSYAEEVIPVIRKHDLDAVILVGTPNWSQFVDQAAKDPITEYDNLMYTLHFYAATHREELRQNLENAVRDGLPIFVSEFGICDASGNGAIDEEQARAWIDLLNEKNISYIAWNLSNKDETSALISSTCGKKSGFEEGDFSESGQWIRQVLSRK